MNDLKKPKLQRLCLLVEIIILSLLSACSNSTGNQENTPAPPVQSEAPSSTIDDEPLPSDVEERLGFTGGNIGAGGLMAGDGEDWVFYRSESDHWSLYKARTDGTEKSKLLDGDEFAPGSINVLNGWVYFSNYWDGFSIYRVRTDGTGVEKLVDGYCYTMFAAESGIYFDWRDDNNGYRTFRMDLDGSNQELLVEGMEPVSYFQGTLYCYDFRSKTLIAYKVNTGETITLLEDLSEGAYFSSDSSGIYFWESMSDYCRLDPATGEVTVLHSGPIGDYYNYADGTLYYQAYGGENYNYYCCYAMDVETGEERPILSLSDQLFDKQGRELGITIVDYRNGNYAPDDMPTDDMGWHDFLNESFDGISVVNNHVFVRGRFQEGMFPERRAITGTYDCWMICDGGDGTLWE